ncbi:hypothetical protein PRINCESSTRINA_89 [Arthrobacter phage PrincessTrina]|uniref:Uncharacterized protein n=1 Tax=Arthrobacter phage PrincessTrina TaxID=1772328 RepID=A0A0U4B5C9_9CAUD|nr:hypothetical protein FDI82_gp089 [Arthrobacter phage PrincessTrina]ALY09933.1 hypothetical protein PRINCESSTRINA_89 [Arthrobacter phage PrincessTrina]
MSTQSSRESWPEMEAQTENLDPANAPLDTSPAPNPEVGDVVLYLTKENGIEVPAMVTGKFEYREAVSLKIFYPPNLPEDPIDKEQLLSVPGTVTYLPGIGERGRWRLRD